MSTNKILTISIAAYNVEKYIENTLDSLICNRMDKLEVIIQNDGSKDNTAELAQKYVDKYPDTFILNNKSNGGYGSTINASLDMATGKYFKQLDGDDWFDTKNLDAFIELLEEVDVDCVFTPCTRYYEDDISKNTIFKSKLKNGIYTIEEVMKKSNDIFKMHILTFRLQLLKDINMRILEHCFYTDQEYIMYPLIKTKTICISDLNIYFYRLGIEGQSVSKTGIIRHYKEHEKVVRQILSWSHEIEKCDLSTKKALQHHLKVLIVSQYINYLILPTSQDVKEELAAYDEMIKKNYPDYYNPPLLHHYLTIKKLRKDNFKKYEELSKKYQ